MREVFRYVLVALFAIAPVALFAQNHEGGRRSGHDLAARQARIKAAMDTIPVEPVETMIIENGTYKINTTVIGADVIGFNGRLPLIITIRKNKVVSVEALPNRETPRFMEMAGILLTKWNGKKVKDAIKMNVDAVTGATYSSKAIKENVRLGLEYYQNNK